MQFSMGSGRLPPGFKKMVAPDRSGQTPAQVVLVYAEDQFDIRSGADDLLRMRYDDAAFVAHETPGMLSLAPPPPRSAERAPRDRSRGRHSSKLLLLSRISGTAAAPARSSQLGRG